MVGGERFARHHQRGRLRAQKFAQFAINLENAFAIFIPLIAADVQNVRLDGARFIHYLRQQRRAESVRPGARASANKDS